MKHGGGSTIVSCEDEYGRDAFSGTLVIVVAVENAMISITQEPCVDGGRRWVTGETRS